GIAKVTINRPEVRNAFTPLTVNKMIDAFNRARDDENVAVIVLAGEGEKAFCSGGDQSVRGHGGYVGEDNVPRLNVLDLQRLIRVIPKPVIAMVSGYAIGAATCCTSYVTLQSLQTMHALDRQALKWVHSMPVTVQATLPGSSDIRKPVKSGTSADSMMHRKPWIWDL